MEDHRRCRLSSGDGELELAGPSAALGALGRLLRQHAEPLRVAVTGGVVSQEATFGPLLVCIQGGTTLRFSGGREYLDIMWDALDGVAEQAETADDRTVNRASAHRVPSWGPVPVAGLSPIGHRGRLA